MILSLISAALIAGTIIGIWGDRLPGLNTFCRCQPGNMAGAIIGLICFVLLCLMWLVVLGIKHLT